MSIEDIQPENGWMPIANDLGEAFATRSIPSNTWRVLWVILREIYGWEDKRAIRQAEIKPSRFYELTGLSRQRVSEAIHWLNSRNIIKVFNGYSENPDIEPSVLIPEKRTRYSENPVFFVRKSGIACPENRNKLSSNGHSNNPLRLSKETLKEIKEIKEKKESNSDLFKRKNCSRRPTPSTFD